MNIKDKIANAMNAANEITIFSQMNKMCEQSLSPDTFEKWCVVRQVLNNNRKALNNIMRCSVCGAYKHVNDFTTPDVCTQCYDEEEVEERRGLRLGECNIVTGQNKK